MSNVVPLTKEKVENFPMMLSKACFNPESEFQRVPFYKFMPLDQILFLIYSCVIICSNTYLYRSYRYLLVCIQGESKKSGISKSMYIALRAIKIKQIKF